jgi:hypothetical protein
LGRAAISRRRRIAPLIDSPPIKGVVIKRTKLASVTGHRKNLEPPIDWCHATAASWAVCSGSLNAMRILTSGR